jgi:hypothetical protein
MQDKVNLKQAATKIKKWIEVAKELSDNYKGLAIPITKLTSIKSLCRDANAAEKFALYLSRLVLQQASNAVCPDDTTLESGRFTKI